MICIKNYLNKLFSLFCTFSLVLVLSACTGEKVTDIDSFLSSFAENSGVQVSKYDVSGFYDSDTGTLTHCFIYGETLISLNSYESSMKIFSADAFSEKNIGAEYKNAVKLMLESLTTLSDIEISDAVEKLVKSDGDFSRHNEHIGEYSLSFLKFDAGNKFTVKFDRLIETEETSIPATQREFREYETIEEFSG